MKSPKVILHIVVILAAMAFFPVSCINGTLDKDQEEVSGGGSEEEPSKDDNFYEDYVKPYTPEIKAIDLGLSVKWGDRNLGSESIEDYGGLYVWGDPTGTRLLADTDGITSSNISGTKYDIATKTLGKGWRLPTKSELEELIKATTVTPNTYKGVKGVVIKSKNNKSIFIPYAGYRYRDKVGFGEKSVGYVWTGDYDEKNEFAVYLILGEQKSLPKSYNTDYGLSVRPVYDGESATPSEPDNPTEPEEPDTPDGAEIADDYDSGDGSAKNPYIIANVAQLRKLAKDVASGMTYREEHFKLKNDIVINKKVLTDNGELVTNYSDLEQWIPIGTEIAPFCGIFDGDNHYISGLFINNELYSQGLFGVLSGVVCNLSLEDSYIKGKYDIGGIVGSGIEKKYEKNYVPSISNCVNRARVCGEDRIGGVAGRFNTGVIDRCGNYGNVAGDWDTGGVIGKSSNAIVSNSYNYGRIEANSSVAGLCRSFDKAANVKNCMNYGYVYSKNSGARASGLIDYIKVSGDIENCVNYGKVIAEQGESSAIFGGLGEKYRVQGTHLYYLETSAFKYLCAGNAYIKDCLSMTSRQMKSPEFLDKLNENVRNLNSKDESVNYCNWKTDSEGYPILEIINK